MKNKTDDILDLCQKIRKMPGMYIGTPSVTRLRLFLEWYMCACYLNNIPITKNQYSDFNSWITKKYNITDTVLWDTFLLDITHDEKEAFYLLFSNLDMYLSSLNT